MQLRRSLGAVAILLSLARVAGAQAGAPIQLSERDTLEARGLSVLLSYLLGTHPTSSLSYVSSVGTRSKLMAYAANRADYGFVPGGVVPGVVLVQPDFWELGDEWPFLWFENEYVVNGAANFILAANAADALLR